MVHSLLIICGCIGTIYGAILFLYSGLRFSFLFTWLLTSGMFFLAAAGVDYYLRNPKKFPLWVPVSLITTVCAGLAIFVIVELLIFVGSTQAETKNLDYVIVLGAKVNQNGVSNSLKKRLDRAVEYINDYPDTILVLSGGQGLDEPVSEAEAMYQYLVDRGISAEQLICENRSTSTTENIIYSKLLIEQDLQKRKEEGLKRLPAIAPGPFIIAEEKPIQIGVLTSDFHIFRSRQIAKRNGISDICHVRAESDLIMLPHMCIRECLAILKDQFFGNM